MKLFLSHRAVDLEAVDLEQLSIVYNVVSIAVSTSILSNYSSLSISYYFFSLYLSLFSIY